MYDNDRSQNNKAPDLPREFQSSKEIAFEYYGKPILEGIIHHFSLPESKVFINGFIATVPVIIDAYIKFWIFSYLTRYSPSTSAIYERMHT